MENILECRHITKLYGKFRALDDVTFSVPKGGVLGLLGPNGSGKTTFIKLAMGMLRPDAGGISIEGELPSPATKAITAYLPDANYLDEHLRVESQIKYYADFFKDFNNEKCDILLERLGISRKQRIKTLSKGNKEKLGLILTMSRDAKLYILDEPIAGVDPAARDFILDTILKNRAPGSTILLCTHLIADIQSVLTHFVFLNRGKVVMQSSVEETTKREGKTLDELFREVFKW